MMMLMVELTGIIVGYRDFRTSEINVCQEFS